MKETPPESIVVIIAYVVLLGYILIRSRHKRKEFIARKERILNLEEGKRDRELMKLQTELQETKTNHLLHFFISIFTFTLWLIP